MGNIKYEIEMLSVGDADCFIIFHSTGSKNNLILIDSGKNKAHGIKIVNHLKEFYPNMQEIDLAINTHLDNDHIGGFETILDNYKIKEFWINDPWKTSMINEELEVFSTNLVLQETLKQSKSLINKIIETNYTKLIAPYSAVKYENLFTVIGPPKEYYTSLIPKFRDYKNYILEENNQFNNLPFSIDRSAENNSSTIILFTPIPNLNYLFTGDAGCLAFNEIWHLLDGKKLYWLDVPHHGSIKNFDKRLLTLRPEIAYISAINANGHPNVKVVESLKAINCEIYCSSSGNILHRRGTESRYPKYKKATQL